MVYRFILGNWLRNAAGQKIREKVVQTAREEFAEAAREPQADEPAEPQRPCDVGVVFALKIEAGGLEDLLDGVTKTRGEEFLALDGHLKGRRVVAVVSGPGERAARLATEALLDGHDPRWVISAGFAGGLSDQVSRHDLLMADTLANAAGQRLAIDLKVDPTSLAQMPGVHVGRLLTVDRIIRLPAEKRSLGDQHQALAVDMESFTVADVCRQRRVRFLSVRVISDSVNDELPPDVQRLMDQKTRPAKLGAVIGAVWNRPSSVKDMLRLKENAIIASDRLAGFLASTIQQLVPSAAIEDKTE